MGTSGHSTDAARRWLECSTARHKCDSRGQQSETWGPISQETCVLGSALVTDLLCIFRQSQSLSVSLFPHLANEDDNCLSSDRMRTF